MASNVLTPTKQERVVSPTLLMNRSIEKEPKSPNLHASVLTDNGKRPSTGDNFANPRSKSRGGNG